MAFSTIRNKLKELRNVILILPIIPISKIGSFLFYKRKSLKSSHYDLFSVKVKNSGNAEVWLRKSSTVDRDVFRYVYYNKFHLPPIKLPEKSTILDLGSNIGLTLQHYHFLYPKAQIIGYEMDFDNFSIAKINCSGLDQINLINAAVWKETGTISYQKHGDEDSYHVDTNISDANSETVTSLSKSITDIIKDLGNKKIDFIKMDIEGAEKDILRHSDLSWMKLVDSINMEIHDTNFFTEAIQILEQEGFICTKDRNHWSAILAIKPEVSNYSVNMSISQ